MFEKIIFLNDQIPPIKIEYNYDDTYFGDTAVKIYDCYKLSITLTDGSDAVIENKIVSPQKGDILILRPYETHFARFKSPNKHIFITCLIPLIFFDNIFLKSKSIIFPFLDNSENRINLISPPALYKNIVINIAQELLSLAKDSSSNSLFDILAFTKILQLLDICNKCYLEQKETGDVQPQSPIIKKVLSIIDKSFPDFVGLNSIAHSCGCSVTYLTHTFRTHTGKTIYNYLTERRLEYARLLLKKGASVTEAAYQSGFYDTSRFIQQFKNHFNITPNKYRKDFLN